MKGYKWLEDYGIIGNLDTCALVGRDGSIDWCCFPHIESPSVFAAILDIEKGGHFSIKPSGRFESEQQYIENTNVLQTFFKTDSGAATLTDFMPMKDGHEAGTHEFQTIYRRVICEKGSVDISIEFMPRFDYARAETVIGLTDDGVVATAGDEELHIKSDIKLKADGGKAYGAASVKEGETLWFVLHHGRNIDVVPEGCECNLDDTIKYWQDWAHKCGPQGCLFDEPWHDLIVRSGLLLKLLTHHERRAICAAPTTSLPEDIGGERNWDYRFNWIRDSAFTVQALHALGHTNEAKKHLEWFLNLCSRKVEPDKLQIMYGLHGETELQEEELPHLSGYKNSTPVRIGNAASRQRQLDVYGELINAIYEVHRYGEEISDEIWGLVHKYVEYVSEIWMTRDYGIWEMRSEPQHFVYSKLMCWVALDRGIKMAELGGFEAPFVRWRETREKIKAMILKKGFSTKLNTFTQSFDSEVLDATALLIPLMGLLPYDDPRVKGTIEAVMENLMRKGCLVYRYIGVDGLRGYEGAFTLCSFWLVNVLALSGRVDEAERIFRSLLEYVGPLGLLSEEISPETGELLGNYPQAFSHIGLINSALYLGIAKGKESMAPLPIGEN
jgi:GH15 family glucan-1,4-alpha-glucosidase